MAENSQDAQPTQPTQATDKGLKIPVPSREDFESFVKKVVKPAGRKRPADSDQPRAGASRPPMSSALNRGNKTLSLLSAAINRPRRSGVESLQ